MKVRPRNTPGTRRGSTLVLVLLTVVALAGISAAMVTTSLFRFGSARGIHEADRAFQAATTGLDMGLFELQEGADPQGGEVGAAAGTVMGADYTVTVTPPFIGPGEYTLRASGRYGPIGRGIEIVVSSDSRYGFGIFARDGLMLNGAFRTDSYDSTLGSYSSQVFGDHARENGALGSNWNIIANAEEIYGDATPGPTYQVLGDPSDVTGSTAPALFEVTTRPVPYSASGVSLGDLTGSANLPSGSYRYDNLFYADDEVLTINGDVTLYVDHDFRITGEAKLQLNPGSSLTLVHGDGKFTLAGNGAVNKDGSPGEMTIISSTTETMKFAGTTSFYGNVYAPEANLALVGDQDLYGAFVVRRAVQNGSGMLHFDESLRIPAGVAPPFRVRSAYQVAP